MKRDRTNQADTRKNDAKRAQPSSSPTIANGTLAGANAIQLMPAPTLAPHDILAVQQTTGNRAVQRMLHGRQTRKTQTPMSTTTVQRTTSTVIQRDPTKDKKEKKKEKTSLVGAKDDGYMERAIEFEKRLGFYTFNHSKATGAAKASVDKMYRLLVGDAPEGKTDDPEWQKLLVSTFGRDSKTGAGQVGSAFSPVEAVLKSGNLREQMTAFYNAAYGGFKTMVKEGMRDKSWEDLKSKDLNVPEIKKRRKLFGKKKASEEMYLSASNPKHRGGLGKFTKSEMFWQSFTRKKNDDPQSKRTPNDLKGYDVEGTLYGAPLSDREEDHLYEGEDDKDGKLPWQEGGTYFKAKDNFFSTWVKKATNQLKMPVLSGPSGSTDRMMDAFKFLKPGVPAVDFRLALLAWMLTGNDHSFHEIMGVAAEKGFGLTYTPGPKAYMDIKPLTETELRTNVAVKGRFPHESGYYAQAKEGKFRIIPDEIVSESKDQRKDALSNDAPGSENMSKSTIAALYSYTIGGYKFQNAMLQWGPLGKIGVKRTLNTIYWYKTQYDKYKATDKDKAEREGNFNEVGYLYQLAADFKDGKVKLDDIVQETKAHNEMTTQALDKLPAFVGRVYRGTTDFKNRKVGDTITLDSFSSTSTNLATAKGFADSAKPNALKERVIMEMDSRTGRDIEPYSAMANETEILFKPNTKFTVVDKKKKGSSGYTHLYMTEGATSPNQKKLEETGKVSKKAKGFFTLHLAVWTENKVRGESEFVEQIKQLAGTPLYSHGWVELKLHKRYPNLTALETDTEDGGETIFNALEDSTKSELGTNNETSMGMYSTGVREPELPDYAGNASASKAYVLDGVSQTLTFLNYIRNRRKATTEILQQKEEAKKDGELTKGEKAKWNNKLKKAAKFSYLTYNCTTFATEAVRAAGFTPPPVRNTSRLGVYDPTLLYKQLYMASQLGDQSVSTTDLEQPTEDKTPTNNQGKTYDRSHLNKKDQKKLDKRKEAYEQLKMFAPTVTKDPKKKKLSKAELGATDSWLSLVDLFADEDASDPIATWDTEFKETGAVQGQMVQVTITKSSNGALVGNEYYVLNTDIDNFREEQKTKGLGPNAAPTAIPVPKGKPINVQLIPGLTFSGKISELSISNFEKNRLAACMDVPGDVFQCTIMEDPGKTLAQATGSDEIKIQGPNGNQASVKGNFLKAVVERGVNMSMKPIVVAPVDDVDDEKAVNPLDVKIIAGTTFSGTISDLKMDDQEIAAVDKCADKGSNQFYCRFIDNHDKTLRQFSPMQGLSVEGVGGVLTNAFAFFLAQVVGRGATVSHVPNVVAPKKDDEDLSELEEESEEKEGGDISPPKFQGVSGGDALSFSEDLDELIDFFDDEDFSPLVQKVMVMDEKDTEDVTSDMLADLLEELTEQLPSGKNGLKTVAPMLPSKVSGLIEDELEEIDLDGDTSPEMKNTVATLPQKVMLSLDDLLDDFDLDVESDEETSEDTSEDTSDASSIILSKGMEIHANLNTVGMSEYEILATGKCHDPKSGAFACIINQDVGKPLGELDNMFHVHVMSPVGPTRLSAMILRQILDSGYATISTA